MQQFEEFFKSATGFWPYEYQARIARDGLPEVVKAPTGAGKTGVILAWLWRRLYGPSPDRTPRRLVYALPPRSLVEHVSDTIRTWLANLELIDEVALHVVLGGRSDGWGDWRENMHQPAVVVGDADLLVSKALNRGYGVGRVIYPMDCGLTANGAQWLVDEMRLCPQATTTLRQLAGLTGMLGTAEPFGVTCLTATGPEGRLATDDYRSIGRTVEIAPEERSGELELRLGAGRTIWRAPVDAGDFQALASFVLGSCREGTLTLVVLNGVPAAQEVYRLLQAGPVPCALLHTQFRGAERATLLANLKDAASDLIVVSTGEAVSGLDLTASTVVTEAAPWPSMVRRIGRANRSGALCDAEVWWLPPRSAALDDRSAVDAACAELARLEGACVTGKSLLERSVPSGVRPVAVIRGLDVIALFDTSSAQAAPATSAALGRTMDVDRYIQDLPQPDVQVSWAIWTPQQDGAPDPGVRFPAAEHRCRVPIGDAVELAESRPVWRFDELAGEWQRVTRQSSLRPYEVLLIAATDGGYDPEMGFDRHAWSEVPDSPEALSPAELAARTALADVVALADGVSTGVVVSAPTPTRREWQSLDEHSEQVRDQVTALLAALAPSISPEAARASVVAGYLHDAGKAHAVWQDALCALADESDADAVAAGRPWAKSGTTGRLKFAGGVAFRHELASLLLIEGPLRDLLAASPDPDLTRYLVLAHHGLLRVQVLDRGNSPDPLDGSGLHCSELSGVELLGLKQGMTSDIPPMLGQPATTLTVELGQFCPDGDRSWTGTALALLDKYGPFTLAYLETVVRVADWRASGGRELTCIHC